MMHGSESKRAVIEVTAALTIVVAIGVLGVLTATAARESSEFVERTHEVIELLLGAKGSVRDAELLRAHGDTSEAFM